MQVQARLSRQSSVYKGWREGRRIGGSLQGVRFDLDGQDYVARLIPPDKLERLQADPRVTMEAFGLAIPRRPEPAPAARTTRRRSRTE